MSDWESMMADVGWWWNGRRVMRDAIRQLLLLQLAPADVLWVELAVSEESGAGHNSWQ